jgi:hypothetical protein
MGDPGQTKIDTQGDIPILVWNRWSVVDKRGSMWGGRGLGRFSFQRGSIRTVYAESTAGILRGDRTVPNQIMTEDVLKIRLAGTTEKAIDEASGVGGSHIARGIFSETEETRVIALKAGGSETMRSGSKI